MKKKSIMSGIDKVISYRMIYPLQHLSLLIMAILLLPLCSVETKAESYYIVNPSASFLDYSKAPNMSEWMKMTPVEGSSSRFTILLPAQYPLTKLSTDGRNFVPKNNINSFFDTFFRNDGFKFVVASKTQIERLAYIHYTDKDNNYSSEITDIKNKFLCPNMDGFNTDSIPEYLTNSGDSKYRYRNQNYWVYKNTESGFLTNYNTKSSDSHLWEIRKPINNYYIGTDPNNKDDKDHVISCYQDIDKYFDITNYWSKWGDEDKVCTMDNSFSRNLTYMQLKDDYRLNGSYRFTIDVSNNTWTMEYLPNTKVTYLAMIPAKDQANIPGSQNNGEISKFESYTMYTLYQYRNSITGKYSNIYSNPSIYLEGGDNKLLFFGPDKESENNNAIISYYLGKGKALNDAMAYAMGENDCENTDNNFAFVGPSGEKKYLGTDYGWGHTTHKGSAASVTPLSESGYYYNVTKYPYVAVGSEYTFTGIIKIAGEGETSTGNQFSSIVLHAVTDKTSAVKSATTISMTYDIDNLVYKAKLTKDQFQNGYFYFQGIDKDGNLLDDYIWQEDQTVNTTPNSSFNANYLSQTSGSATNEIYYTGSKGTDNEVYDVTFKIGTAIDGSRTFSYWIDKPNDNISVTIPYKDGYYLRTFSYPENVRVVTDNVDVFVVKDFKVDKDTKSSDNVYTAKAYLKKVSDNIPANTGVILRWGSGSTIQEYDKNGKSVELSPLEKDGTAVTATPYTVTNYLVPSHKGTLGPSEMSSGEILKRNYFLSQWSNCDNYDKKTSYVGFFRVKANSSTNDYMAYLQILAAGNLDYYVWNTTIDNYDESVASENAKGIALEFDEEEDDVVSGVSEVETNTVDSGAYYTLTGIKVANPSNGIYIHDGKKIYIK